MVDKTLIGERPPLPPEYRRKIQQVHEKINTDALFPFTPHELLLLAVDRMHAAYFPDEHTDEDRKRFYRLEF